MERNSLFSGVNFLYTRLALLIDSWFTRKQPCCNKSASGDPACKRLEEIVSVRLYEQPPLGQRPAREQAKDTPFAGKRARKG